MDIGYQLCCGSSAVVNPAINLVPFGRRMLRDKAALRLLARR